MKVLVTGGCGFIGQYVVANLVASDHDVLVFDVLRARDRRSDVSYVLGDVRDATSVDRAVAECDGVIHCAGVLGTAETIDNPMPAVDTNIVGGLNVFQAIRRYGVPAVNIKVGNHWMNNPYSITKSTAERLALMFNKEHGTSIAVVRGLNAYGPGQKDRPVRKIMPNFVLPAIKGEAITIYGDGSQIMDMIYVSDVAEILVRALFMDHGVYSHAIDAGTGRKTSVLDIAKLVVALAGSGTIEFEPMRPGEPEQSVVLADTDTLQCLDINPGSLVALEYGVRKTIEHYRHALS